MGSSTPQIGTPRTLGDLKEAGWRFSADAKCKACGVDIEWWTKGGSPGVPFNPTGKDDERIQRHFPTCPKKNLLVKAE